MMGDSDTGAVGLLLLDGAASPSKLRQMHRRVMEEARCSEASLVNAIGSYAKRSAAHLKEIMVLGPQLQSDDSCEMESGIEAAIPLLRARYEEIGRILSQHKRLAALYQEDNALYTRLAVAPSGVASAAVASSTPAAPATFKAATSAHQPKLDLRRNRSVSTGGAAGSSPPAALDATVSGLADGHSLHNHRHHVQPEEVVMMMSRESSIGGVGGATGVTNLSSDFGDQSSDLLQVPPPPPPECDGDGDDDGEVDCMLMDDDADDGGVNELDDVDLLDRDDSAAYPTQPRYPHQQQDDRRRYHHLNHGVTGDDAAQ
jgi:hypothetical protein